MIVSTPKGDLLFLQPSGAQLRQLRLFLPLGAVAYREPAEGGSYGVVMKCGDEEAFAMKQQPPDGNASRGPGLFMANCILIAKALEEYRGFGFGGLLMPCAYMRRKPGERIEAGIAYFGRSCATGIEATEFPYNPYLDDRFGHGFTTMFSHFHECLKAASRETGITLFPTIGFDYRPRSKLGTLQLGFAVLGSGIYTFRREIAEEEDPVWTVLRGDGITEVYHVPAVPAEILPEEYSLAKPEAEDSGKG